MNTDLDSLGVICPTCGGEQAISLGRRGNLHLFQCRQCGAEYTLREREALQAKLMRHAEQAGYQVADRGNDFTLVATFERTDGSIYSLEYAVRAGESGPVEVRRLLDDQWHAAQQPTLQGVLKAIEAAEITDTAAGWPTMPEYHAQRLLVAEPASESEVS